MAVAISSARLKAEMKRGTKIGTTAFNRAEEMATAMEARGYRGAEGRTKYRQLAYSPADRQVRWALLVLTLALLASRFWPVG